MAKEQKVPAALDWKGARGETRRAQLNGIEGMLRAVDDPLIDALGLDAPYRIADIGCGGGGTSLAIFRRAPRGSAVRLRRLTGPRRCGLALACRPTSARSPSRSRTRRPPSHPSRPTIEWCRASGSCVLRRASASLFEAAPPARAEWSLSPSRLLGRSGRKSLVRDRRDAVAEVVEIPAPIPDPWGRFATPISEQLMTLLRGAGFGELEVDLRAALPMGAAWERSWRRSSRSPLFVVRSAPGRRGARSRRAHAREALVTRFSRHEKGGVVLLTRVRPDLHRYQSVKRRKQLGRRGPIGRGTRRAKPCRFAQGVSVGDEPAQPERRSSRAHRAPAARRRRGPGAATAAGLGDFTAATQVGARAARSS